MCLLALVYRVIEDAPLVVGANREEYYQRGGEPPRLLADVAAVAGVDPLAGGTWLGVNARGVLIAVTNRRKTNPPTAPRSRGILARELLAEPTAQAAVRHAVRELEQGTYAGCNFLCADASEAVVIHAGDWLRVRFLPPGIHVLANRDVNDPTDPRATHASLWLAHQTASVKPASSASSCLELLRELCASHEPECSPVCYREENRGTVSSTLVALSPDLTAGKLLHAQGPPDVTPYQDVSYLLAELARKG
jgi:uncharacterized protein with NRDE domain